MAAQAQRPQQEEAVTEEESFGPIPVGKLEVIPPVFHHGTGNHTWVPQRHHEAHLGPSTANLEFSTSFCTHKADSFKKFYLFQLFSSSLYVICVTLNKTMHPGYVTVGN